MALGVWCGTAAFVMAKWHVRSLTHLLLYLVGAFAVCWAGGPAGNLWSVGLAVALVPGWFARTGRAWKCCALVGGAAVLASASLLLRAVPPSPPQHLAFLSQSWGMTFRAAAKCSVAWMGGSVLLVIWPWALLVLVVPGLYLLIRLVGVVQRQRWAGLLHWSDLTALFLSTLLVAVAIGHGRARYPGIWESRYVALVLPIAAVLYLLLVRAAVPKTVLGLLAFGMATCVGWNWQTCIAYKQNLRPQQIQLVTGLRYGSEPLSVLAERYPQATGWGPEWGVQNLVRWWQQMRQAGISVFARDRDHAHRSLLLNADSGTLGSTLRVVPDPNCVNGRAVQVEGRAASAVYQVTVPQAGNYLLCFRWQVPSPGQGYTVQVDNDSPMKQTLPALPGYRAYVPGTPVRLEAGTHSITVTWPGPGSRLDVVELTRR
jgi:hypothetical protein